MHARTAGLQCPQGASLWPAPSAWPHTQTHVHTLTHALTHTHAHTHAHTHTPGEPARTAGLQCPQGASLWPAPSAWPHIASPDA
jgi:hypothetical protein